MSRYLRAVTAAVACCAVAVAAFSYSAPVVGHAAGTGVTASRLSVFRPSGLPPSCGSQTIVASADTYITAQQTTKNYGDATALSVQGHSGQLARMLVAFTLPAAPAGCTLASATLRASATSATSGRTLDVYRASTAWTESGVTWASGAPATTGTAVGAASGTGWLQWTVTAHVQAHYSGANNGFIIRDSNETQTVSSPQVFASRETTNKPELVLQWQ